MINEEPIKLDWAKWIVEQWDKGEYPSFYGYQLACRALGINQKPKEKTTDRKTRAAGS